MCTNSVYLLHRIDIPDKLNEHIITLYIGIMLII